MALHTAWIGLGSNLGDRHTNLLEALQQLRERTRIVRVSSVYETEPAYYPDQPWFLNMVAQVETELDPVALFRFLKRIERRMGRQETVRYGPRVIDLDLLLYDDLVLETPELVIPHPRMTERAFVLVPLAEIAPDLVHPQRGQSMAELAALVAQGEGRVTRVRPGFGTRLPRDVQGEPPTLRLGLSRVGITGLRRIVRILDGGRDNLFYAEMDLYVDLGPNQRGVHMSRFSDSVEEILEEATDEPAPDLETVAERMAHQLIAAQDARRAEVCIRAHLPTTRYAPASGKATQKLYTLLARAASTRERTVRLVGIEVEGMMACPCAQDMIRTYARERLLEEGIGPEVADRVLQVVPLATHNQRGTGRLVVGGVEAVRAEELASVVEAAMSAEIYDLLKRPDELFLVAKAHRRPRFVEDAVREMIRNLLDRYPDLPDDAFLLARQTNFETIHPHDVYAEYSGTVGQVRKGLGDTEGVVGEMSMDRWIAWKLGIAPV
ncbi:MAG: GTP cyclohydrolase MptA [Armatimonadota bacterium]|nr:GTP cyclohydrolase MptA [Armatimonadota bacterium]MDR7443650.1 GTP cyclohydrolase MptA [Armatimonadota bacterium]MDR7570411.1 GTP cyclohydrolase MptA [Armatimonadota bacterium]MDR7613820.1 GTP cyclohydrolase MptA [Armatimonadota bacterium]